MKLKYIQNFVEGSDETVILLHDDIGTSIDSNGNLNYGIDGSAFAHEIQFLQDKTSLIKVHINSSGGNVMDGFSIITAILNSKVPVNTYIDGIAASIAGLIAVSGNKVHIVDYGILMMHNPSGGSDEVLDIIKKSLSTIFTNRTKLNEEEIDSMMDAETWLMADDALAMGLVDTIISSERDIKMPQNKSQKEMAMIYNKIINPKKEMKDVTNKLGLKNDVSEDVIVSSINELQNEAEDLAKMLKEAKDANEVLENKLKVIEEAEVAKKEKEILDMVENHIKEGRAEESSKNELIEASNKAGFDFVNSMLSKVGSKKSVKVTDKIKATNGGTSLSYIELSKKNPAKLMEIKNSDPALYKQLFDAHYNK